jgi:hypothetical protein
MKNRSRYEVIAAILKSVNKEETRTKISASYIWIHLSKAALFTK